MALTADSDPSTLKSVFILETDGDSWAKLECDRPLCQLHTKSWRKDIAEEEQEGSPDFYDDSDDIGPGCYALDFGIEHFERSKLWIRNDYLLIYDYCNEHYDRVKTSGSGVAPSVVITGQPGVGKSYWVYYAVRRRLGEGKPFIWYRGNQCFLFVEEGVFVKPLQDIDITSFVPFLWTFVDADNSSRNVPSLLVDAATKIFTILVCFPQQKRWAALCSTTNTVIVYMNPWTDEEIHQAALVHGFTDTQLESATEMCDRYGPTPRIGIDFVKLPDAFVDYKRLYDAAFENLSVVDCFEDNNSKLLDSDEARLTVFLIRRDDSKGDSLLHAYLDTITPLVRHKLKMKCIEILK